MFRNKNYILENILEAINSKKWIVATKYLAGGKWYLRTSEIIRFAIKKTKQNKGGYKSIEFK